MIDSKQVLHPKATVTDVPEPVAALEFWKALWEKTTVYNGDAGWPNSVDTELHFLIRQPSLCITLMHTQNKCTIGEPLEMILYTWKKLWAIHSHLPDQLQEVLDGSISKWLVMGRITLIPKDKTKGPVPSNYRPITCLPTIWKLLTSILSTVVRKHLTDNDLLFSE